jgi:Tol biopolymer transport system component
MSSRLRIVRNDPSTHRSFAVIAAVALMACGGEPTATRLGPPVALSITPIGPILIVGEVEQLTARASDAKGRTIATAVAWSSADPGIASVNKADGRVTAISVGSTTVTATAGTLRATVSVSILPVGIARLSISAFSLGLLVGSTERLTAQAFDAKGRTIAASVEWSTANSDVATVGKVDGVVTGISFGTTTVMAAVGALSITATVFVLDPVGAIAFTRTSGSYTFDVLTYAFAERTIRSLPRASQFASLGSPAWSPNGTQLAVEVIQDVFIDDINHYFDYVSNLYVLRAADSLWRALTTDGRSRSPSWSPDGARIAYIQRTIRSDSSHIYLIDAGGGVPTRLTTTAGGYGAPRWSPDGTRLAFSNGRVGNGDIFVVNADGSGLINVTQSPAYDVEPNWSPDGSRLAFVSNRDTERGLEVFVIDAAGGQARRLTTQVFGGSSSGPVWSPDGRHIAFSLSAFGQNRSGIYVMNADGSTAVRLTTPPPNSWDSAPTWRR